MDWRSLATFSSLSANGVPSMARSWICNCAAAVFQTIVLGGVATNIGVESTARQAWEHGYAVVLAEDATSGLSAQMHDFAIDNIFPRISRVVKSADLTLS